MNSILIFHKLFEEDTCIWQPVLFFLYLHSRRVFSHLGAGMLKNHLLNHKFPVLGEGNDCHKTIEFASSSARSKTNVTQCPGSCLPIQVKTYWLQSSLSCLLARRSGTLPSSEKDSWKASPPPSLHWTSLGTYRISSKPGLRIALYCLGMDFAIHLRMLISSIALSGITPILLLSHHFLPLWQPTWKLIGHVDNCYPLFYWQWIPCGKAWTKNSTYLLWSLNSWYQILCE